MKLGTASVRPTKRFSGISCGQLAPLTYSGMSGTSAYSSLGGLQHQTEHIWMVVLAYRQPMVLKLLVSLKELDQFSSDCAHR